MEYGGPGGKENKPVPAGQHQQAGVRTGQRAGQGPRRRDAELFAYPYIARRYAEPEPYAYAYAEAEAEEYPYDFYF